MKRTIRNQARLLAGVVLLAWSAQASAADLTLLEGSKLRLTGKSTVHAYESTASRLEVSFKDDDARWTPEVKGAEAVQQVIRAGGVVGMEVTVPVTGLKSGKDGLDKNMYKALLAPKHPEIRFRMAGYEVRQGGSPDEMAIDAKGTLSVAGVDREVQMLTTAVREGEAVRMRGSVPLRMTQFGIKPPTMMMGTMRTSDEVVVHFDLLIGARGATMSKAE
jgi:polyisoprenoid-binding protein YceI